MIREPYEAALDAAVAKLHEARQLLAKDISAYPSPISGCDAQFNQLLSDRARLSNAIRSLGNRPFVPTPGVLERGAVSENR